MITGKAQKHIKDAKRPATRRRLGSAEPQDPSEQGVARLSDEMAVHDDAEPQQVTPIDTRSEKPGEAVGKHRLLGGLLLMPTALLMVAPFFVASSYFANFQLFGTIMSVAAGALLGLWAISHFRRANQLEKTLQTQAKAASAEKGVSPGISARERIYH